MKKILLLSLSLMWASVFAGEKEDAEKAIRAQIAAKLPNMTVEYIDATPVPGLYEVSVSSNLIYMSADGRYILVGDLTDMETSTNLTEEKRNKVRKSLMDSVDETQTIVFSPENPKYMVTVFTDIDCGYCRKMH
ncbi:MAG: DsbC family protein, partial [bacterium]